MGFAFYTGERRPSKTQTVSAWVSMVTGYRSPRTPSTAPDAPSDRVGNVDELVLQRERLGHQVAQRADTEDLRGMVAGGQEVDAGLGCPVHRRLRRLAGDERVCACVGGRVQVADRGAGNDGHPLDA